MVPVPQTAIARACRSVGCHTFRATEITAYLANGGAESRAKGIAHAKAAIEQLLHGVYKQAA
jgi:hypothetical protein